MPTEILIGDRRDVPPLDVIGRVTEAGAPLVERVTKQPLLGRVRFHGYVSEADRRTAYERASVLVLPSWHEGFGLPALEAMALGVPVVAARRGALVEVIGDSGALVEPNRPDQFADALRLLLDDRAIADEMAMRGTIRAQGFRGPAPRRRHDRCTEQPSRVRESMHIAIDARELTGDPTGAGRYLAQLLAYWNRSSAASRHRFSLYAHRRLVTRADRLQTRAVVLPGAGGTRWEQLTLSSAMRRDRPDVLFAPAYTAPLLTPSGGPSVHDVSFAAHPEWFRPREGWRRRTLTGAAARRAASVLTLSKFSRSEIVRHLRVLPERVRVIPRASASSMTRRRQCSANRWSATR